MFGTERGWVPVMAVMAALLVGAGTQVAWGSDLVEVLPLTDRVLMLHFDDGHVEHHKLGRPRHEESVVVDPLDVEVASRPQNYQIISADDPAYRTAKQPVRVGRKSKGTDFAWFADKWVNGRAVNERPDHAKEHWVYLVLPSPLQRGPTYRVETGSLARNGTSWTLVFDEREARSEAVHVNLLGYVPGAPAKYAYVSHWLGDLGGLDLPKAESRSFRLLDQTSGKEVFRGPLRLRMRADQQETAHQSDSPPHGNFLKSDVYECDFSAFATPGQYVVAVDGVGCSFPFRIEADVYRPAFRNVARALYHNRSGIALEEPFTKFTRPAPHNPRLTPGFDGKLLYTTVRFTEWGSEGGDPKQLLAEARGPLDAWGWYQDAGDWDSYYSHLRVAQELLLVYQVAPRNFSDGELNIPESGNGVPDLVDEAAWLPRFLHRLRQELIQKGYGTGGVGLRVAGDAFGSDEGTLPDGTKVGQGSWQDTARTWVVSGEDPWSSYRYAGVAAQLAEVLGKLKVKDPEGVDWRKEAVETYQWARSHTRPGDDQKRDPSLAEPRLYASAALWRLTGEPGYQEAVRADSREITPTTLLWGDALHGPAQFVLPGAAAAGDQELTSRLRGALLATADQAAIETPRRRAMRWGGNWYMPMLVGQQTTPMILEAVVGHALTRDVDEAKARAYLSAVYSSCDYVLGCNALNTTWVTGLGPRHPNQVFHMDAWYNGKDAFHPGLIPYGPWRKEKDLGQGPWDVAWPHGTVYPKIDEWPGNERWFDNRCSPMNSEFTVHQNLGPAAAVFGFLCAPATSP